MSPSQSKLQSALQYAFAHRPRVGGFPFLAECLSLAGVERNVWSLPAAQSIYVMADEAVVNQGQPLVNGMTDVPKFDEIALIAALRKDQAGESTFPEFLLAAWNAGVISYEADFAARTVTYYGAIGEKYIETYPAVEVGDMTL